MSDGPVDAFVTGTIRQHIGRPMTEAQRAAWEAATVRAYQELWMVPAFQVVLEHWFVAVVLTECETPMDEGRRRFVLDVLRALSEAHAALPMHIEVEREGA